ncbi:MAG: glycosyltransferase family 39 protein [Deltaproteobacteria bacterium]|nr:glycosyltransferase family 39 protein [Deltaproteobacteria bacterium]
MRSDLAVLFGLALAKVIFHLVTSSGWGIFRDELYYLACANRLDWGYVDHPPLSIAVLALSRALFGDSLLAIRLPVALAGGASVFVTGLIARELGGRRGAQVLAGLATCFAPQFVAVSHFFSMNAFDVLFWALLGWLAVRILRREQPRLWLAFGAVAGLGLQNKLTTGVFIVGLIVGLALSPQRRQLLSPWLWLGGALAAAILAPHLWWQLQHGFPTAEFTANAGAIKNVHMGAVEFFLAQITLAHPLATPLWLVGLWALAFSFAPVGIPPFSCPPFEKGGRGGISQPTPAPRASGAELRKIPPHPPFSKGGNEKGGTRALAIAYAVAFALLVAQNGKVYYLTPIYPLLYGAGAAWLEAAARRRAWGWPMPLAATLMLIGGAITTPLAMPLLSVEQYQAYAETIGLKPPRMENNRTAALPQIFADMFGWEDLADTVARAADRLTPEERARAVIYAQNYGEAGAIERFGPARHLPRVISGHNTYWLWGPGDLRPDDTVIVIGGTPEQVGALFASVELVETRHCTYCMPFENDLPIYFARQPRLPLDQLWQRLKRFV